MMILLYGKQLVKVKLEGDPEQATSGLKWTVRCSDCNMALATEVIFNTALVSAGLALQGGNCAHGRNNCQAESPSWEGL